jgi:lipoprotein-anchoring transpeptidase ErfK/SrfK
MKRSALRVAVFAFTLALALGLGAAPALALYDTTVPNHALAGSVDLFDMTEAQARDAIAATFGVPALALQVNCAGKAYSLNLQDAVTLDVDALLASAYTTPSVEATFTLAPRYTASSAAVSALVTQIASAAKRPATSAAYYVSGGSLLFRSAVAGAALDTAQAAAAIKAALLAEVDAGTPSAITLSTKAVAPAVTDAMVGPAIIVDISSRRLWLHDRTTVIATHRVAVGMRRYPTPLGTFKVTAKKVNPTWRNPGSKWAKGMPKVIKPGRNNPLGTRALYINSPGIRIHGTAATRSIGTAASHGCIRVANKNIEKLYPMVPVGTPVFIVK